MAIPSRALTEAVEFAHGGDQPLLRQRARAQLEDQHAHLRQRTLRQIAEDLHLLAQRIVGGRARAFEILDRRARVEGHREEFLRHRIMQIAREAKPLLCHRLGHRQAGILLARRPQFPVDAHHLEDADHADADQADLDEQQRGSRPDWPPMTTETTPATMLFAAISHSAIRGIARLAPTLMK